MATLPATQRPYRPGDFLGVRDFLVETFPFFDQTPNWRIEHWEWCRYHVVPMLGSYGKDEHRPEDALGAIAAWEGLTTVWETGPGSIAGLVISETPWPGGAFLMRRPGYDGLLPAMLDRAEAALRDPQKGALMLRVYEHDESLRTLVASRGYARDDGSVDHDTVFELGPQPEPGPPAAAGRGPRTPALPAGHTVRSMGDDHDSEARRELIGRMFGHADPREWPSRFAQVELRKAPDYHPELDLAVVDPAGRYAAYCLVWADLANRIAILEPVGTHPDYRRRGLGRAVVLEGIRRAAALGITQVWVGSSQQFYTAIGFRDVYAHHWWVRRF